MVKILIAVAAGMLWAAAPACAAVVTTRTECEFNGKGCTDRTHALYRAGAGERNDVSIRQEERFRFTISDSVPIEARKGCEQLTATSVTCFADDLVAELGDGDDAGRADDLSIAVSLDGGTGDDTLAARYAGLDGGDGDDRVTGRSPHGGAGRDVLIGTDGNDFLDGGDDEDEIHGGAGDDNVDGGTDATADVLDGGPGADTISYGGRPEAIDVNIADQTGGTPGEGDDLSGFENARGGLGSDHLVGDDGPNTLESGTESDDPSGGSGDVLDGAGGADHLRGGANRSELYGGEGDDHLRAGTGRGDLLDGGPGDDLLSDGFGRDTLVGGAGNDQLLLDYGHESDPSGPSESVACGAGRDDVRKPRDALVPPDCETVVDEYTHSPAYPHRVTDTEIVLPVHCPVRLPRCNGVVTLRLPGERRPFASRSFKRRHGRANVHLKLPERIVTRTKKPLRVRVTVAGGQRSPRYPGSHETAFGASWVIDLSAVLHPASETGRSSSP